MIRMIERDGWVLHTQKGSHRQFKHPAKKGKVTVAGKESTTVPPGTLGSILKQAELRGD